MRQKFFKLGLAGIILVVIGFLAAQHAPAHDPYEITTTASVLSNRFEITATFEYRAARLLAGFGWPTNQVDVAREFSAIKPALEKAAESFFQVSTAGKILHPDSPKAQLSVENHVTFTIAYPATGTQPVVISVPGLATLVLEGQYGVGMTVLDMVQKKVLGQHVFTGENYSTRTTFGPPTKELATGQKPVESPAAIALPAKTANQAEPPKLETESAQNKPVIWPWFVAAAIGVVSAWWLRRRAD